MVAGGSDSAAAAISLSISSSNLNRGSLGIGTSGVILYLCSPNSRSRRSGAFVLSCRWWILFAGSDVSGRWLCVGIDTFAPNHSYTELMDNRSLLGASGVLFLPHLSGERSPHLDPDTRGAFNLSLAHAGRADSCCTRGRCIQPAGSVGGNQRDNSRSSTLGRWRSAPACGYEFWQMFCKQNSLLRRRAALGAAIGNGGGAYPNLEAAFKIPQDKVVQPQVNPVYECVQAIQFTIRCP